MAEGLHAIVGGHRGASEGGGTGTGSKGAAVIINYNGSAEAAEAGHPKAWTWRRL